MIIWWVFLGVCVLVYGCYDAVVNGPTRRAQAQWERNHFTGWRLEAISYETEHGMYYDNLNNHERCTTRSYPGYPACPAQQYLVNGQPQAMPVQSPKKGTANALEK
jgi:hypothetical protein